MGVICFKSTPVFGFGPFNDSMQSKEYCKGVSTQRNSIISKILLTTLCLKLINLQNYISYRYLFNILMLI